MSRTETGEKTVTETVDLSVVVPAYNEERRLAPTLDAVIAHLDRTPSRSWELIVVDDGSTDATAALVTGRAAADPRVRLLDSPQNKGKGHALRLGVAASRGRRVLVTDADLATPVEELEHLEKELADGGAAIASRSAPGATIEARPARLRQLLGSAGNFLIRRTTLPGIRDTQCGFKLYDGEAARDAYAASRLDGWATDVEVLRRLRQDGRTVTEVPVRWAHQPGSKLRPLDYPRFLADLIRLHRSGVLAALLFLAFSVILYSGRFFGPDGRYLTDSLQDQNQWEWFFAVTADNVAHLRNPLFTDLQGYPDGVNLMANTVMLGLSVPLTPVTLLLGPAVALSLCMTLGLAATAVAWYRLLVRRVVDHRPAAFLGAALAAFAPPMISHANAHPNFVVLFMIPPIVERALRLCEGTRPTRDAIVLGLMAAYQCFLGEEALLLAALGMTVFAVGYAVVRPDVARRAAPGLLRGLAVAASVCLPVVCYPLLWQFHGPQSYTGIDHGTNAGNSPLALLSFAERSLLAGDAARADALSLNPTEQNAFYGFPLVLLALAVTVLMWRSTPVVRVLGVTASVAALLSLGPRIGVPLTDVVLPGPWALLGRLPLLDSVIEGRVAMVCAPVLGMLVAIGVERLARRPRRERYAGLAAVCVALLPLVPAPLKSEPRAAVPAFFADGAWKAYVGGGETLVPVPLADPLDAEALHWQVVAGLGFRMPGGYFNGPYGDGDRTGVYGVPLNFTSALFADVHATGVVPVVDAAARRQARADLAGWRAGALVVPPGRYAEQLRETVEKLVGRPGEQVGGVWVWDLHEGQPTKAAATTLP
ncbi:dolichyl-phosphate beta-glucosyltransferase [Streptomyces acidiscabies]|uniref:dolichyl-phosphate beta-glucosyltransferase n=1 Tax=Streptomyces acidiscabies TaxID=42234 RepID=A0AAP6BBD2_9ACTN|nr:dolichyl-phosphate beta-glucosyltransferase [Streptomyces acidiscabies]MBP5937969.1 glycosyltransferase family 2 protein [Streptomyces sp. LBUM 1476]MBZ3908972.1 glycosyltransferase family 2 protein [Streptomyces acidiscabies]MDX2961508.1 glycosyltransferase family 2 protein [Streptomyces acidiscabies]MDX3016624.1 glycosyltransferase family 2 protein [Streptomyces acidiscabies]MDX3788471.1 glycosyltransferase family 2 protein [Streptomyces acidiscabies]